MEINLSKKQAKQLADAIEHPFRSATLSALLYKMSNMEDDAERYVELDDLKLTIKVK